MPAIRCSHLAIAGTNSIIPPYNKKFLMKTYSTSVSIRPEMTVPHSESNGFFTAFLRKKIVDCGRKIYTSRIFS